MDYRHSKMKKELIHSIQSEIPELNDKDIDLIIKSYYRISESKNYNPGMELITIDSIRKKGNSIKPGNIILNMKNIIIDSSEISLALAGVPDKPYVIPLVALITLNKVWSRIKIDFDESHAMIIKIMWENRDIERNWIEEIKAYRLYNQYKVSNNQNPIIINEFELILADLEKIKCIKKHRNGIWWLKESVRITI